MVILLKIFVILIIGFIVFCIINTSDVDIITLMLLLFSIVMCFLLLIAIN